MRATGRAKLALRHHHPQPPRPLPLRTGTPQYPGLPQSHRQPAQKRLFRFLSDPRFDPIRTQCALMPVVCRLAAIKGQTPIMYD